jgi:hypothetical protein
MKKIRLLISVFLVAACLFIIGKRESQAELVVYDSGGQFLGISVDGGTSIYVNSLDIVVSLSPDTGSLSSRSRYTLYFVRPDCTGTPYGATDMSYYAISGGDNKFYMAEKVAPTGINYNSILPGSGPPCRSVSGSRDLVPVKEVITPFALPVAIPLVIEHEPAHPGKWKK